MLEDVTLGNSGMSRSAKIEGGRIHNLIGGPTTTANQLDRAELNHIYMYITGGTIDWVIGGAGTSPTSGNRVLSLTGGVVNYSVFGGSNGYNGVSTDATLRGSSFIYVGGNHQVGNEALVANNTIAWGSEAGSVFGIGNGRDGASYTNMGSNDNSNIIIDGDSHVLRNVYGGGNYGAVGILIPANSATQTNIQILGGTIERDVYGGGNRNGSGLADRISTVNITMRDGSVKGSIYGGSNIQGTVHGSTNVNILDGNINGNVYGGGRGGAAQNNNFVSRNVNVNIGSNTTKPTINGNVYGGSAFGTVNGTTNNTNITAFSTNVSIHDVNILGSVFGGGEGNTTYRPWVLGNATVNINNGNIPSVYGGNDQNGNPNGAQRVNLNGGTITEAYGGGRQTASNATQVYLQGSTVGTLYGGSNINGNVTTSNVIITAGTANTVFGGNNAGGVVTTSNVTLESAEVGTIFGGNNAGGTTTTANVTLNGGNVTDVYGGGRQANTGATYVRLNNVENSINSVYGGGFSANVTTSNVTGTAVDAHNIFGGSNTLGTVTTSNITIQNGKIGRVFGGNNAGGTTTNTNVNMSNGEVGNIYGGGLAAASGSTRLNVTGGLITTNVYGGGEEGAVTGNTNVNIRDSEVKGSVYAGGNGATAIVHGNTNLNIAGGAVVGTDLEAVSPLSGSVFGGGNAAATGLVNIDNSTSTVNIVGGTIYGNVYGGANTSVVYGYTNVNIGYTAVNDNTLIKENIYVRGTIFGGGEANADGSENYDFDFISVTKGIDITINGGGYTREEFITEGSIFGSGNASSAGGYSNIYIKDFGTIDDPQRNISIQRANTITLDHSAMVLNGATDRTNDYADVFFAVSRVDELKLKNNSTLYLNYGANLLRNLTSAVDITGTEVKGAVIINEDTGDTMSNVQNRIYMREGRNLNIATNEQVTAYGEVNGMFFLGLYTSTYSPVGSTGPYHHSYNNNDIITNEGTFSYNSYALGAHKLNHNTRIDGFYTNYNEGGQVKKGYIEATPDDDLFYMWIVGEDMDVTVFNISLTASKYSTLGTTEIPLVGFGVPNARFFLTGFSAGLVDRSFFNK
jgi:hypothetical protein